MCAAPGPLILLQNGCCFLVRDSVFGPCTPCRAYNYRADWNSSLYMGHKIRGGRLLPQKLWDITIILIQFWLWICRYRRTDFRAQDHSANFGFYSSFHPVFARRAVGISFWDGFRIFLAILYITPFTQPISASAIIVFLGRRGCIFSVLFFCCRCLV